MSNFKFDCIDIPLVLRVLLPEVQGDAVLQPYVRLIPNLAGDPGVTSESTLASLSAIEPSHLTATSAV